MKIFVRFVGYSALAIIFWLVTWAWAEICQSDSGEVGLGFYVFLFAVYVVFARLSLKLRFTPTSGWPRYLAAASYGAIIMVIWIITGIGVGRWIYAR